MREGDSNQDRAGFLTLRLPAGSERMKTMITVVCALIFLMIGYMLFGRLVERVFAPDDRETPAYVREDGVDFVPMETWKAFLV